MRTTRLFLLWLTAYSLQLTAFGQQTTVLYDAQTGAVKRPSSGLSLVTPTLGAATATSISGESAAAVTVAGGSSGVPLYLNYGGGPWVAKLGDLTPTITGVGGQGFTIARTISGIVPNLDQFRDESEITASGDNGMYASFDASPEYKGASAYDHLGGYQDRLTYSGSGTLSAMWGFWSSPVVNSGTVSVRQGVWIKDVTGAGSLGTNYGVRIASLTKGSSANWSIYTEGVTPSYFGGAVSSNSGSQGTPAISAQNSAAGVIPYLAKFMAANATYNQSAVNGPYVSYGIADTTNNSAVLQFWPVGAAGSVSNRAWFGLYGNSNGLSIDGNGQLTSFGAASGTAGGAGYFIKNGASVIFAAGNKSSLLGGAYDATPYIYSNATLQFSAAVNILSTTDSTTKDTGSIITEGGIGAEKNITAGGAFIGGVQSLSGAGAVNVTTLTTEYTSTGAAQALSLADGSPGQIKIIVHGVDGGSGVLTPTTKTGYTTITFTAVGESAMLQFVATRGWIIISLRGAVAA